MFLKDKKEEDFLKEIYEVSTKLQEAFQTNDEKQIKKYKNKLEKIAKQSEKILNKNKKSFYLEEKDSIIFNGIIDYIKNNIDENGFSDIHNNKIGHGVISLLKGNKLKLLNYYADTDTELLNQKINLEKYDFKENPYYYLNHESNEYSWKKTKSTLMKNFEENYKLYNDKPLELVYLNKEKKYSTKDYSDFVEFIFSNEVEDILNVINNTEWLNYLNGYKRNFHNNLNYSKKNTRTNEINEDNLSISLEKVKNILIQNKIKKENTFRFNDSDNGAYLIEDNKKFKKFVIFDQNVNFGILYENKDNYIVFDFGKRTNKEDKNITIAEGLKKGYFDYEREYTNNQNSDNFITEKHFIITSMEDLKNNNSYILKSEKNEIKINQQPETLWVFLLDLTHTLKNMEEELVIEDYEEGMSL
jgi:hypothetical protein